MKPRLSRRAVLSGGLLLGVTGCTRSPTPDLTETASEPTNPAPSSSPSASASGGAGRVLLVYFSRAGENYHYGGRSDLEVGNTEVLATMIADLINCDTYRIEASDPYPDGYDVSVERNVAEQDADARPAIADPLASIEPYTIVLLGSPIWNMRPPMIMSTFAQAFDFTGKTVHPFVTYAVSGLGSTQRVYTEACSGARIGEGWPCGARRSPSTTATSRRGCETPGSSPPNPNARPEHLRSATPQHERNDHGQAASRGLGGLGDRAGLHGPEHQLRRPGRRPAWREPDPRRARAGVTFFDTAEAYGPFSNETLSGRRWSRSATRWCSRPSSASATTAPPASGWTAGLRASSAPWTAPCSDCGPTGSTCSTSTASTRRCRSRTWPAP
jgi:Flavodoxin